MTALHTPVTIAETRRQTEKCHSCVFSSNKVSLLFESNRLGVRLCVCACKRAHARVCASIRTSHCTRVCVCVYVHARLCVWGQLNEGGSFDRQLVCGAAIDSPCACVCSTALGEFHAPWATWQSTSDRELLISTEARRLALWGGWICDSLAEREERRERRRDTKPTRVY